MILKFASLWPSPSPPYRIRRKNFPEGATASCRPLTPASVSGWGVITSRLQLGEGVLILFQKNYTTPNTRVFATTSKQCHIDPYVFLVRKENPWKTELMDRGRRQVKLSHWPVCQTKTSVSLSKLSVPSFVNKVSRLACYSPFEAPAMYLGLTYQPIPVDSDSLTQAYSCSYLRKKSLLSRHFSTFKNLNPVV